MFAEIALQTILAAIVGAIWLTPLVVSPAARSSLDEEALKFFLKTFFFRFHLFIVILLFSYLSIIYFFQLKEYELIWSSTKNLVMFVLLGANTINLLFSLIINNVKIDQFPLRRHFKKISINTDDVKEIIKNCNRAQSELNLKNKINFFKTHSSFWKISKYL